MNKIIIATIAIVAVVLAVVAWYIVSKPSPVSQTSTYTSSQPTTLTRSSIQPSSVNNLNLGILYPNDLASIGTSKDITVSKGGNYTLNLTNYQGIEKDFSLFTVLMIFSNSTMNKTVFIGWGSTFFIPINTSAHLFLSPGVYNLTLGVSYYVKQTVTPVDFGNISVKMGNSSLITVNFKIQTQPTTFQNLSSYVKPIFINIGELSNVSGGPFSNLSTITITSGGEYLLKMLNTTKLEKDFKAFYLWITLSNSTESISVPVGFSYFLPPTLIYNNTVYLSPGVYKMNVSIYYNLNDSVTSMSFRGTIVELGNAPLVNVSFTVTNTSTTPLPQPPVTQVGTGVIYKNGTAVVTLHSTESVEIVSASIVGTTYTANTSSITNYQLTAGINTVTINFGSSVDQYLQPGTVYTISLTLSDGITVEVVVLVE